MAHAHVGRAIERVVGDAGADLERAVGAAFDGPQLLEAADVDEHLDARHTVLEDVEQTLAAGEHGGTVVGAEFAQRLIDALRARVLDRFQQHAYSFAFVSWRSGLALPRSGGLRHI